jgi:thiol-disulfide isomerase/thioredoxin
MENPSSTFKLRSLMPLVWAGLFMLCGILVLIYLGRDTARLMNSPLGEIELRPLLDTNDRPTIESLEGKAVLFHFWGTWCGPCREEFPEFAELQKHWMDNPSVVVLSVSCSPSYETNLDELRSETKQFLDSLGVLLPTYSDPNAYTRSRITKMLAAGGFSYPFTLIIDKQGIVRDFWLGAKKGSMQRASETLEKLAGK